VDIYLDQNQWISLARAFHGRGTDSDLDQVVDLAAAAVDSGRARFPISRLHLLEATKKTDDAQRNRLVDAFIHFSRGWILRPAEALHVEELLLWFQGKTPRAATAVGRGLMAAYSSYEAAARHFGMPAEEIAAIDRFVDSPEVWRRVLSSSTFRKGAAYVHASGQNYAQTVESVRSTWAKLPPAERRIVFAEGVLTDTVRATALYAPDAPTGVRIVLLWQGGTNPDRGRAFTVSLM
jgi:hypothetical protein